MHWILLPYKYIAGAPDNISRFSKSKEGSIMLLILTWHLDFSCFPTTMTWLVSGFFFFFNKYFHGNWLNKVSFLVPWQHEFKHTTKAHCFTVEIANGNCKFYSNNYFSLLELCSVSYFPATYKLQNFQCNINHHLVFLNLVLLLSFLLTKIFSVSTIVPSVFFRCLLM